MRIFVSSSFEDLHEHRAAAIRVLRQLGHEVLAMEDMVAGTEAPLTKVRDMVDRSEAYVGIFAWRYGYVPQQSDATPTPQGPPSITHSEYLRAKERGLPIMAFLLDGKAPWPPPFIDGQSRVPGAPKNSDRIRALRDELQKEKVISWFTTPSDLEARVAAAVTMAGLSRQIDVQPSVAVGAGAGSASVMDSGGGSIGSAVAQAKTDQRVFRIDLADEWWSTRLYLIAALAERLTRVRRIVVVRTRASRDAPALSSFIGQLATATIIATLRPVHPELVHFENWLLARALPMGDLRTEAAAIMAMGWAPMFGGPGTSPDAAQRAEAAAAHTLNADLLCRWFGDSMLQTPVEIADLKRASIVDLLRLVDYPSAFVPVMSGRDPGSTEAVGQIDVLDKAALNARLAHSYLVELKERARIV